MMLALNICSAVTRDHSETIMTATPQHVWIKQPLAVFTANQQDASNGIVIDQTKGVIKELVPRNACPISTIDETFDASQCVLMPGLVNTHHHLYQTLTCAVPAALNKHLFPWLQRL